MQDLWLELQDFSEILPCCDHALEGIGKIHIRKGLFDGFSFLHEVKLLWDINDLFAIFNRMRHKRRGVQEADVQLLPLIWVSRVQSVVELPQEKQLSYFLLADDRFQII